MWSIFILSPSYLKTQGWKNSHFLGYSHLDSKVEDFIRVLTGYEKFLEIKNAIFQDLESFGKGRFFKMALEKFLIVVWENSKIS